MTKWVGDPFGSGKRGLERNERWHDQCVSVLKNDDYNPLWLVTSIYPEPAKKTG